MISVRWINIFLEKSVLFIFSSSRISKPVTQQLVKLIKSHAILNSVKL